MSALLDLRRTLFVLALVALLASLGCAGKGTWPDVDAVEHPVASSAAAPVPDSPAHLMQCFAWDLNRLDPNGYAELLTDDFEFRFSPSDSAGNLYRDHGMFRVDELEVERHLLVEGTATLPPARRLSLALGSFIPYPDSRPGKTYPCHLEIRIGVTLSIDTGDRVYNVTGSARFFVVRGDSASIPADLAARGVRPDPRRWWIERWDDETAGGGYDGNGVENAMPAKNTTWGSIKALYR